MRVLLVNTYDNRGGAARSVLRIFNALKKEEIDVKMLVQNKRETDNNIIGPSGPAGNLMALFRPYIDFALAFPWHRRRTTFFPAFLPGNFIRRVERLKPDLVQLNWITGGFVRIEDLALIKVPVVWMLHDMWAFTGGCHYAGECRRFEAACGNCPILKSGKEQDISRWIFNRKMETYFKLKNLTIVTPSNWLAECVSRSPLLGRFPVEVIHNALDTSVFYPEEKSKSKAHFGFHPDKNTILFGALDATGNRLKGYKELTEALQLIPEKDKYELAVFGSAKKQNATLHGFSAHYLGYLESDIELRKLYSAADVMVVPSIQEVFGQTATEAMACAAPVVAFGATGLLDIIEHKVNGFLAEPFKPDSLAEGITWCLESNERNNKLSLEALETVKSKFEISVIVQKFINLYNHLIYDNLKN